MFETEHKTETRAAVDGARAAMMIGGLSERVLSEAEAQHGSVDWRPLAGALDGLYMASGSRFGVRRFWTTPTDALSGRTPMQVLVTHGDLHRITLLARSESARVELAKLA